MEPGEREKKKITSNPICPAQRGCVFIGVCVCLLSWPAHLSAPKGFLLTTCQGRCAHAFFDAHSCRVLEGPCITFACKMYEYTVTPRKSAWLLKCGNMHDIYRDVSDFSLLCFSWVWFVFMHI